MQPPIPKWNKPDCLVFANGKQPRFLAPAFTPSVERFNKRRLGTSSSVFRHTYNLRVSCIPVITKGYWVRATTIEGQNTFAPALLTFHVTDGLNTRDQITSDKRSKPAWRKCVLCIPYILKVSPNECWLHTSDVCVIATWRLGLRTTRGARNNSSRA